MPSLYNRGIRIEPKIGTTHTDQITVMTWVKFFGPASGADVIAQKGSGGSDHSWKLKFYGDRLWWLTTTAVDTSRCRRTRNVELKTSVRDLFGQWMHIAATANGERIKLYVNGQLRESARQTDLNRTELPLHIGGGGASGSRHLINAVIDELAIFRTALSESEIKEHYRVGRP